MVTASPARILCPLGVERLFGAGKRSSAAALPVKLFEAVEAVGILSWHVCHQVVDLPEHSLAAGDLLSEPLDLLEGLQICVVLVLLLGRRGGQDLPRYLEDSWSVFEGVVVPGIVVGTTPCVVVPVDVHLCSDLFNWESV